MCGPGECVKWVRCIGCAPLIDCGSVGEFEKIDVVSGPRRETESRDGEMDRFDIYVNWIVPRLHRLTLTFEKILTIGC